MPRKLTVLLPVIMAHIRDVDGSTPSTATNFLDSNALKFLRPGGPPIAIADQLINPREWHLAEIFFASPRIFQMITKPAWIDVQIGDKFQV